MPWYWWVVLVLAVTGGGYVKIKVLKKLLRKK
jgi:hypothetical protein